MKHAKTVLSGPTGWKRYLSPMTVHFKSCIITLLIITLITVFYIKLSKFNTTDPIPPLTSINTEMIKQLGTFTVKVKLGLFIKNIPNFDIMKNSFVFDSIVWFEFNSDEIMLETVEKFSFDKGKILYRSPSDIKVSDNKVFAKYNVLFETKSDLNFHKFPFEDHRVAITLSNDFVTPSEMYFVVDTSSFQMAPNILPTSWKLHELYVDTGFQNIILDKQDTSKKSESPKTIFVINVSKAGIKKILVIFVPLFAMVFFSFFSFFMNISNIVGKFSIAISAVTALLGYRFVIEQMTPSVAYFTTTDEIYILLLIISLICFIFQLILTRHFMIAKEQKPPLSPEEEATKAHILEKFNSFTFLMVTLLFISLTIYIILK